MLRYLSSDQRKLLLERNKPALQQWNLRRTKQQPVQIIQSFSSKVWQKNNNVQVVLRRICPQHQQRRCVPAIASVLLLMVQDRDVKQFFNKIVNLDCFFHLSMRTLPCSGHRLLLTFYHNDPLLPECSSSLVLTVFSKTRGP